MEFISYLAGAILIILFVYVLVRTASFAYFKTRLEHFRVMLKELNNGGNNKNG